MEVHDWMEAPGVSLETFAEQNYRHEMSFRKQSKRDIWYVIEFKTNSLQLLGYSPFNATTPFLVMISH
jgi:hypothetical protein